MYSCDDNDDDADDDDIWTIWSPTLNTVPVYGSGVTSNFGPPPQGNQLGQQGRQKAKGACKLLCKKFLPEFWAP